MIQTTLSIDGMMCGMCESHINDCIRRSFAVKKVSSSHSKGQTVILSEAPLDEDKLKDVIFLHKDYRAWNPTGCVIYMDPPYENTKQYKSVEIFDHADFWRVARLWSHDNIVLISEQEAPDDFVPVWIHSVTRTMNQNKTIAATEKLFVAKEVLEREEIVAAV